MRQVDSKVKDGMKSKPRPKHDVQLVGGMAKRRDDVCKREKCEGSAEALPAEQRYQLG